MTGIVDSDYVEQVRLGYEEVHHIALFDPLELIQSL